MKVSRVNPMEIPYEIMGVTDAQGRPFAPWDLSVTSSSRSVKVRPNPDGLTGMLICDATKAVSETVVLEVTVKGKLVVRQTITLAVAPERSGQ